MVAFHCRFLWNGSVTPAHPAPASTAFYASHDAFLTFPLSIEQAVRLELSLQRGLALASGTSVFAVRRHDEPYAPPVPLVLLAGLFDPSLDISLEVEVIVRPIAQQGGGSRRVPRAIGRARQLVISLDKLRDPGTRAAESALLVSALRDGGVARLALSAGCRAAAVGAMADARAFFASASAKAAVPFERVDTRADLRRGVGYVETAAREYVQIRRALRRGDGAYEQPAGVLPAATPPRLGSLFAELEAAAVELLEAVARALELPEGSLTDALLDSPLPDGGAAKAKAVPVRASEADTRREPRASAAVDWGGASVLRCYRYKPRVASKLRPALPGVSLQGAHADLGLLTISPLSSLPMLDAWDSETLVWRAVERDACEWGGCDALVFAGETLALLTAGRVPAVVHKVDLLSAGSSGGRAERFSMPFFSRARPDALLRPLDALGLGAKPVTTTEFMDGYLFRRRPWRAVGPDGHLTDY
jgi:isopenicillin N synthase-like dioxygenase